MKHKRKEEEFNVNAEMKIGRKKVSKMTINFHLLSISRVISISNDDEEKEPEACFFVALCAYFHRHHRFIDEFTIDEG